jgi:MFS transporter, ACS family, DAL5 transporter family protein
VIRQILVRENAALDAQDLLVLKGAKKERVEEYARREWQMCLGH